MSNLKNPSGAEHDPAGTPQAPDRRPAQLALAATVFTWGMQAIVTQSLILREAMVLMAGSELAWGIVLSCWLLGVALGGAAGARLAGPTGNPRNQPFLVTVLLALSCAAIAELWLFRGARAWLQVAPGEFLPLHRSAAAALAFVTPASFFVGSAFPLACAVGNAARGPDLSFARVYALESAGSLVGGAVFSFWAVETLSPIQIALFCGALNAAACGVWCLSAGAQAQSRTPGAIALLMAVAAAGLGLLAGPRLAAALVQRRWNLVAPGYELMAETESRYQNLALGRRAGQYSLFCDGQLSADFPDPYTFGPLAHFYLCQHPAPRNILLVSGGAEGLLHEILLHPVEHVDYVETDPRQISLLAPYLPDTDRQALADVRVSIHHADARYYIKTQSDRFDLVIARLPEPISALRARFFTDEFFAELRRACRKNAVLCFTAAAAPGELTPRSREYLGTLVATLKRHFPHVIVGWGDPAQILAATAPGLLTTSPDELAARYTQRGIESLAFDPAWFFGATDWLEPTKLERRAAELADSGVEVSTDLRPIIYVLRLILWEAATGSTRIVHYLRTIPLAAAIGALAVTATVPMLLARRHPEWGWLPGAVNLCVASTGFATMALSLLWLFAFQNLYGYVYQRIGWIVALFMAGLVAGCLAAERLAAGYKDSTLRLKTALVGLDLLLALLSAAAPAAIIRLSRLPPTPPALALVEASISSLVLATGLLGGAVFPLATALMPRAASRPSAAAGTIVAADHAGACVGALLCGVLLVPAYGTIATALVLAGLKLGSATVLIAARRHVR